MKDIEKGSVKQLVLIIVTFIVVGLIVYPILDYLYCKLITRSAFTYSITLDVVFSLIFCSIMGVFTWFEEKKK